MPRPKTLLNETQQCVSDIRNRQKDMAAEVKALKKSVESLLQEKQESQLIQLELQEEMVIVLSICMQCSTGLDCSLLLKWKTNFKNLRDIQAVDKKSGDHQFKIDSAIKKLLDSHNCVAQSQVEMADEITALKKIALDKLNAEKMQSQDMITDQDRSRKSKKLELLINKYNQFLEV
ncbi:hypothetical protein MJO28_012105 [Puccinia striiformis f. sp. tritici]|uniref:Uncharacterized protein n=1 Tax=Puccinia striiformis f. sp. tritici TaxID=168172 RepID=A0ACC0E1Z1_9BASI|nr:hypothetical protein MJO28_012105 [Puccinia striiformis f. sp. tritici]